VKFSTGPRPRGCVPCRRIRVIHRAIIDMPRPTVTSQVISAASLSAAWLDARDGGAVTAGGLDAGTARIRPATYWLSRPMSSRWATLPRTPAAAARSARPTATFTSSWLRPWHAAGTEVTVTRRWIALSANR
jgi:hypothetical protein